MKRNLVAMCATLVLGMLLLSACSGNGTAPGSSSSSSQPAAGNALAGKTIDFIIYATPDTPFFNPVVKGAQDAAKIYGVTLNVEYSNSNTVTQNNQIQTAIARNVSALALSIPDNSAFTNSVCDAHKANIPIIAFNVTATEGQVLNCVSAFVGQDFVSAGNTIAQRMIDDKLIQPGAHVFCPVEDPTAVYAQGRAQGANDALSQIGAKCDVVGVGFDLSKAQTTEEQYLLGHRNTTAILALGQVPLQVAPSAAQTAGVQVAIGGFDLSPQISDAIKSGKIAATVEQQPYSQGYFSVLQLELNLLYGLTPSSMNTGDALVDKTNVDKVAALAGQVY